MKIIKVKYPFKHSDDGNIVNEYGVGDYEVSDRCAEVAINQLETATLMDEEQSSDTDTAETPAKPATEKTPKKEVK
jgi:hypothetical protein